MTVSGTISTTVFDVNRVIDAAYRRCKIPAQRITSEMQQIAIDALYLLLSSAPVKGVQLWAVDNVQIPMMQGASDHPMPVGTIDVLSVNRRTDGNDLPLVRVARDSYDALPDKSSEGVPSQFWLDRQRDVPALVLWQTPNAAMAAGSTLVIRRKRHLMDITSLTQTLDVPQRWHNAIIAELAKMLSMETPEVPPDVKMDLKTDAAVAWKLAQTAEEDSSPMRIIPRISGYTK